MPRKSKHAGGNAAAAEAPVRRSLLDDDDDDGAAEPVLTVNQEFARRFQHNKEREELHRLQAKHGAAFAAKLARRGRDGDEDEDEDEDDEESSSEEEQVDLESALDDRFLETLLKIRRRDPSIYQAGAKLLGGSDEEEEEEDERAAQKQKSGGAKKPVFLREVQAKQLLERANGDAAGESSSDEDVDEAAAAAARGPTYAEEQEQAKREFLAAVDGDEPPEDGLLVRKKGAPRAVTAMPKDESRAKLVSTIFEAPAPDQDASADAFLKDFLLNKRWIPRHGEGAGDEDDGAGAGAGPEDDSGDDLERVEQFEAQYNFRFEEPGGATLVAQPRRPDGVVRKPETSRAEKRKAKAERVNAEKERLKEELKRLKNLKKREIEQKLQSIARVAGVSALPIAGAALDEDEWDPETHEAMMGSAFGSAYYDLSDEDEGELKKPQFDDMDDELKELLTSQKVGERGFADAVKRAEARAQDLGDGEDDDGEEEEEQPDGDAAVPDADGESNRFSKRAMKKWKRALDAKLEEYYSLDCEDFVAGMPCRFRYREVAPDKYGLKTEEMLLLSDKELNQVVSLKKLAPYRPADPKPRYGDKRQRAEAALGRLAQRPRASGSKRRHADDEAADAEDPAAARLATFTAPTKKARREFKEQQKSEPKLTKNAAKRLRKKRAKMAKQQVRDDIAI